MVVRTNVLCTIGIALALGGYFVGLRVGDAKSERRNDAGASPTDRLSNRVNADLAKLDALAQSLDSGVSKSASKAGPATVDSLEALIVRYPRLTAGDERDEILRRIVLATQLKIGKTRDLGDLAFFRELLRNPESTRRERHAAMIVAHPLGGMSIPTLLAYYENALGIDDSTVRAFAAEGLAWMKGPERQRALEIFRGLLIDADPKVRQMVAGCLAAIVRDPKDADLLARALESETDNLVATEIVDAIETLDPAGFRNRLRDASKKSTPAILPLIEQRMTTADRDATK